MIIQCKCKKYKFKIPKDEIIVSGHNVKCEICNQEWSLKLDTIELKNRKLDILQNINPSKLNIGNKMCFVTLENPSVMGWNPQVRTFVYELVTNEERKFAAQLLMDREVKRAVRKFGRKKVKASFSDNYVQLNLDLYNMPLDFGGAIEA